MLNVRDREIIVKLHGEGKKQDYIADLLDCSQPTVHRWIRNYTEGRTLKTLLRSGRPTKLTKERLSSLKDKILFKIKKANQEFNAISTKEVAKFICNEVGVVYSMRHVERIMHKLGFSLITPRPQHVRHDQEKVNKFRDEFKKKLSRTMWAMK